MVLLVHLYPDWLSTIEKLSLMSFSHKYCPGVLPLVSRVASPPHAGGSIYGLRAMYVGTRSCWMTQTPRDDSERRADTPSVLQQHHNRSLRAPVPCTPQNSEQIGYRFSNGATIVRWLSHESIHSSLCVLCRRVAGREWCTAVRLGSREGYVPPPP